MARELRTNATKQENHLWYDFLRSYQPRFTRQRIVGNYILDFYCAKVKLVVELDGSQHFEVDAIEYDKNRTKFLKTLGIHVIRFANIDIDKCFEGVCNVVDEKVKTLLANLGDNPLDNPRPCGPPPSKERG
jgi:very-short-patch-repair endonuclease